MNCVVISFYDQRDTADLAELLRGMQRYDAGAPYRIQIVINQTRAELPQLDFLPTGIPVEVMSRENVGYNIGAWEAGWRTCEADAYLFLQQECRIRKSGWLQAFLNRFQEPGVGLVGESLMTYWDEPWEEIPDSMRFIKLPEHDINGEPVADRVECYLHQLKHWGIDPGPKATHLQSLVLCTTRPILEQIDGFPIGRNYGEAIAAEIGISRKVEACGYRLRQVGSKPFTWIDHPQWTSQQKMSWLRKLWHKLSGRA